MQTFTCRMLIPAEEIPGVILMIALFTFFGIIFVIVPIYFIAYCISYSCRRDANSRLPLSTLREIKYYLGVDPSFSAKDFKIFSEELFINYQNALCEKDMSGLRKALSSVLYSQSESRIKEYLHNSTTRHISGLDVSNVYICGWRHENDRDIMVVSLSALYAEYITDDNTGSIVSGRQTADPISDTHIYNLEFARTAGIRKPGAVIENRITNCPKCGADIDMNQSAKCPYCGTMISVSYFDWILSSINEVNPVVKTKKKQKKTNR